MASGTIHACAVPLHMQLIWARRVLKRELTREEQVLLPLVCEEVRGQPVEITWRANAPYFLHVAIAVQQMHGFGCSKCNRAVSVPGAAPEVILSYLDPSGGGVNSDYTIVSVRDEVIRTELYPEVDGSFRIASWRNRVIVGMDMCKDDRRGGCTRDVVRHIQALREKFPGASVEIRLAARVITDSLRAACAGLGGKVELIGC